MFADVITTFSCIDRFPIPVAISSVSIDVNKVPWSLINSFADVEDAWDSFKQLFVG